VLESAATPVASVQRAPEMSEAQLMAIMPRLQRHRSLSDWLPALNKAMAEFGITTVPQRAAFLAQVAFESTEMRIMEEAWGPRDFQLRYEPPNSLAASLGNTQPGDGQRYKGRGLIQITGRTNYDSLGKRIGVDLVDRPELAIEPDVAARVAAAFWAQRGLNALADSGQFDLITRRINGGAMGQAERQRYFEQAKAVLQAGP